MSIFNDKALKGVAEAAAKIMAETSHGLKGNQHKIDANKNGKIDAHDFKLLRAGKKPEMKKEETEQLDELSKATLGSYAHKASSSMTANALHSAYVRGSDTGHNLAVGKKGKQKDNSKLASKSHSIMKKREAGLGKAISRLAKEEVELKEETQLDEAFPSVEDAKKRMSAGKTSTGTVTKTKTGLVHKRDYEDEKDNDDAPKKKGYGARQNYKRSTRVNESLSFTEMLELYNEHGIKVLAPIEVEEEQIGDQTVEVIDADKVNGVVETIVEEPDNEQFTKELKDQEKSAAGKKPQPKVAAGRTMGVKTMPESVEQIDEVSPPGREKQVKALKKVPGITNPYAVSWASYRKSHPKKSKD